MNSSRQDKVHILYTILSLQPIINNFNILMLITDFCKKKVKNAKNVEILIFKKFKSKYFVSGFTHSKEYLMQIS